MTPYLAAAIRLRRCARVALDAFERDPSPANVGAMCTAVRDADAAYAALDGDEARAYRRWAFATCGRELRRMVGLPALEVVR